MKFVYSLALAAVVGLVAATPVSFEESSLAPADIAKRVAVPEAAVGIVDVDEANVVARDPEALPQAKKGKGKKGKGKKGKGKGKAKAKGKGKAKATGKATAKAAATAPAAKAAATAPAAKAAAATGTA